MNEKCCHINAFIAGVVFFVTFCVIIPLLSFEAQMITIWCIMLFLLLILIIIICEECCSVDIAVKRETKVKTTPDIVVIVQNPDDSIAVGVYKTESTVEND
jgi:hypothetical protein